MRAEGGSWLNHILSVSCIRCRVVNFCFSKSPSPVWPRFRRMAYVERGRRVCMQCIVLSIEPLIEPGKCGNEHSWYSKCNGMLWLIEMTPIGWIVGWMLMFFDMKIVINSHFVRCVACTNANRWRCSRIRIFIHIPTAHRSYHEKHSTYVNSVKNEIFQI